MIRLRAFVALFLIIAYRAAGGTCEECLDTDNGCPPPIPSRPVQGHSLESISFPWTTNRIFVNSTLLYDTSIVASPEARLWQKRTSGLKACMDLCTGECQVVDYDGITRTCTAYNEEAGVTFAYHHLSAVFSPIRKQMARLPGFRGMDLIDLEYENKNSERSTQEEVTETLCWMLCLLHPQCDAAIFDVTLESCQLKRQQPFSRSRIRQEPLADKDSITFFNIWKKDFIPNTSWYARDCDNSSCTLLACIRTSNMDIDRHLDIVGLTPMRLLIMGKIIFEPASIQPILDRIILFTIGVVQNFDTSALSSVHFSNLLELEFFSCNNITIRKGSFSNFPQLRLLSFVNSTILLLEAGVLETLPNLKSLALGWGITWPLDGDKRSHLWRLHCSREYSWFRNYLTKNPHLIQPRSEGEVFWETGVVSHAWSRRQMYSAVDCGKENLKGLDDQIEFSLNPEN